MQKDQQWHLFLKSLFRAQYTRKKFTPDDAEKEQPRTDAAKPASVPQTLSDVLYEESQGITDLAVKMYMFAQERAIDTGREIVTANIVRSVAKDRFAMLRRALQAIRYQDKRALANWDDVYPAALKEYLTSLPEQARQQVAIRGIASSAPDVQAILKNAGVEAKHSEGSISSQRANTNALAAGSGETVNRNSSLRGRKSAAPRNQGLLPGIVASLEKKNDTAAYEALKQAGHIHSVTEST